MIDIYKLIKESIETENISQLTALLSANVPSETNHEYIYQKQQIFITFITIAHLLWPRNKPKVSFFVKRIIINLHKIGFVSKRKGDITPKDSKKLLDMLGQIEHEDYKRFDLDALLLNNLKLFIELLTEVASSETEDVLMTENTTMNIRRNDDIPTLKLKKK